MGCSGASSATEAVSGMPYTAAVDENTKNRVPASAQTCNRFNVLRVLLL
jgi:hypothetical protein